MKELSALICRDTTEENCEFWKLEMGEALREIQRFYDDKMETVHAELETAYNLRVSISLFNTGYCINSQ